MKNKKILIILGHPNKKSFGGSLIKEYIKGLEYSKNKSRILYLGDLKLEPFLKNDYTKEIILKNDLLEAQKMIKWADHLVFFFPIWWATTPALLKTFLEIVLQRNFAYKYQKPLLGVIPRWKKLLTGKTARIVMTLGAPSFYYKVILGDPAGKTMKAILNFCGIKIIGKNYFGSVELSSDKQRLSWLNKMYKVGLNE